MVKENKAFYLEQGNGNQPLTIKQKMNIGTQMKYVSELKGSIQFGQTFMIVDEDGNKTTSK